MNKNQKHLPYSYSKLIKGTNLAISDCEAKIEEATDQSIKAYWEGLHAELVEKACGFSLAQSVCGDSTVLVR